MLKYNERIDLQAPSRPCGGGVFAGWTGWITGILRGNYSQVAGIKDCDGFVAYRKTQ